MSLAKQIANETPEQAAQRADEALTDKHKRELRAKRKARREVDAEDNPPAPIPSARTLGERLKEKRRPVQWRIWGWLQRGHRVMLIAQYKAGKTTFVLNVVRSLVDVQARFLDKFDCSPCRRVTILDVEMATEDRNQLDDWYEDIGIKNKDAVRIIPLRGRASSFNILDPDVRARWVQLLSADSNLLGSDHVVVLDCLRPILDALQLDEHKDAGKFLVAFDALLTEAGVSEAIVVHHMGHSNERGRGDSRIQDWPDALWFLVRENDELSSDRFVKADGRDVHVSETRLDFNSVTRRMSLGAGSRGDSKAEEALPALLQFVAGAAPGASWRAIKNHLRGEGFSDALARKAIKLAETRNLVTKQKAANGFSYTISPGVTP